MLSCLAWQKHSTYSFPLPFTDDDDQRKEQFMRFCKVNTECAKIFISSVKHKLQTICI